MNSVTMDITGDNECKCVTSRTISRKCLSCPPLVRITIHHPHPPPLFLNMFSGPGRLRQINLGGSSYTPTQEAILDSVKAQREQRLHQRRQLESTLKIQAWWRGTAESKRVKGDLKQAFDRMSGPPVEWTRLLVVGWSGGLGDSRRLARWSSTMLQNGNSESA